MEQIDEEPERTLALVSKVAKDSRARLRFPDALESLFEMETQPRRCRALYRQTAILAVFYGVAGFYDYPSFGELYWLAVLIRLTLLVAPQILILWIVAHKSSPALREGMLAFGILTATMGTLLVGLISESPMRIYYPNGIVFILLYVIGIERLRFGYALTATIAALAFHAVAIMNMGIYGSIDEVAVIAMAVALATFVLYVNYMFERDERRMWLRAYGDRLRAAQFQQLAEIDPMTGLGNRRAMQNWLDAVRDRAKDEMVSFVIADIDHFKSYNDTFGHMQGDDCIRSISYVLSDEAKKRGGRAFRFGGEEFVVVFIGYTRAQTYAVAEAMRQCVLDTRHPHRTPEGPGLVSCSFGFATDLLEDGFDVSALITEADVALYAAKRAGRNQVMPPPDDEEERVQFREAS